MASVVVDASIVVQWVIEEAGSEQARTLLEEWLARGIEPVAPSWLACEVTNILYKKVLRGELSLADALDAFDDMLPFVHVLAEDHRDAKRARYRAGDEPAADLRRAVSRVGGADRRRILDRRPALRDRSVRRVP